MYRKREKRGVCECGRGEEFLRMLPSDRNDGDIMGALGVYGERRLGEGGYEDVLSRSVSMSIDSVSIG